MIQTKFVVDCHSIEMLTHEPPIDNHDSLACDSRILKTIPQDLAKILQHYAQAFAIAQGLPPNCNHDTTYTLCLTPYPLTSNHYCYPHFQKETMSKIIA